MAAWQGLKRFAKPRCVHAAFDQRHSTFNRAFPLAQPCWSRFGRSPGVSRNAPFPATQPPNPSEQGGVSHGPLYMSLTARCRAPEFCKQSKSFTTC